MEGVKITYFGFKSLRQKSTWNAGVPAKNKLDESRGPN
jgi:hypothetical protein